MTRPLHEQQTRPHCRYCDSMSLVWLEKRNLWECKLCKAFLSFSELNYPSSPSRKHKGSGVIAGPRSAPKFRPLDTTPWERFRELCEAMRKR